MDIQSVEKHEGYLLSLLTDTMMFKQALLALREVSMRLSKRFSEYGATFTDKADPDIETSSRSCQKMADFMEGFARTLATCVCFFSFPTTNVTIENIPHATKHSTTHKTGSYS